jgi:uncharacterized LabA/DUF88 family protein
MPAAPTTKRTVAFIDGQALFHGVKGAFGYNFPNFDPTLLAKAICERAGLALTATRFYTGVPSAVDNAQWNFIWSQKLAFMGSRGVHVFTRPLRYHPELVTTVSGPTTLMVPREKGIDVRIALDVVRLAREQQYDIAMIFSQDQDLAEVVGEVRAIAASQSRWMKVASAFPTSDTYTKRRGIDRTDWHVFDKALYDSCLDPNSYRWGP